MIEKKCLSCGTSYSELSCPVCESKAGGTRKKMLLLSALIAIALGIGIYFISLGSDRTPYGKDAFSIILSVDKRDPSKFLAKGFVNIKDGQMASGLPGAVFVVGVPEGVRAGGKSFSYRQIILLNPKGEHVLAPPGTVLTIPDEIPFVDIKPGRFVVPSDSMIPQKFMK